MNRNEILKEVTYRVLITFRKLDLSFKYKVDRGRHWEVPKHLGHSVNGNVWLYYINRK